jgi:hypothetical protein
MQEVQPSLYRKIISKCSLPSPWDHVVILVLNVLIAIPVFIILHQNLIDLEWVLQLDRILMAVLVLLIIQILLRLIRTVIILGIGAYLIALFYGTIFGGYGFGTVMEDYNFMLYSMMNDPNPENIILSKLLPFPNKTKIIEELYLLNYIINFLNLNIL